MADIRLDDEGVSGLVSELRGHSAAAGGSAGEADLALADTLTAVASPGLVAAFETFAQRFRGAGGRLATHVDGAGTILDAVRTAVGDQDDLLAAGAQGLGR